MPGLSSEASSRYGSPRDANADVIASDPLTRNATKDPDPEATWLLRELRRLNARSEASRLASEAETAIRAERFAFVALHAEHAVRTAGDNASSLAAALDTRNAAIAGLRLAEAALAPGATIVAAAVALDEASLTPRVASPGALDRARDAERDAKLQVALHTTRSGQPAHHATHAARFNAAQPSRWLLERVPAGTGHVDWSLLERTHADPVTGPAWRVVGHAGEETLLRAHLIAAGCAGRGSWPGHAGIDSTNLLPAGNMTTSRGDHNRDQPHDNITTSSRSRFKHDPIPSHIVRASVNQKTHTAVPQRLLRTLTRAQSMAPRHPAYLLNSRVRHADGWHVAPSFTHGGAPLFSSPVASASITQLERRAAVTAMVPDRSLAFSDPTNVGKPGFLTDIHPPTLFSRVQLDYAWLHERAAEEESDRHRRFWLSAAEANAPFVRQHDAGGATLPFDATLAATHVDDEAEADAAAQARAAALGVFNGTGSAAGAARIEQLLHMRSARPDGTASPRTFAASSRQAYKTSLLGEFLQVADGTAGGHQPALTLLKGLNGRFAPLRSALVFATAEGAVGYEKARAAVSARMPMGARAFDKAHAAAKAALDIQEEVLERRGVSTGLGSSGRASAARRIHDLKAARSALEMT